MDKLGRNIKAHPIAWGVGAVVAVAAGYMTYDWARTRKNVTKVAATIKEAVVPKKAPVASEPRGKLPWAIGDVNLWDDEDDSYCSQCSRRCNTADNTEPCMRCRERCPMNS